MRVKPNECSTIQLQNYLQGVIGPRPIAFVSSINREGSVNLSPFSFFNMFSINPPILVFSSSRRVRDNSIKHTLENIYEVNEVVINVVNYAMVQQVSLASTEYPKGVNEFFKAGFTPKASEMVKPPCVAESPASFECRVKEIIPLGKEGGAGNLVICEVLLAHIKDELIDSKGNIDPQRLDAVARMGNNWYCRAQGDVVFEVPKPLQKLGIGVDQIPMAVRLSSVLTGNDLGQLGNVERLPSDDEIEEFINSKGEEVQSVMGAGEVGIHAYAKKLISQGKVEEAWKILLTFHQL